jgi:hypothetical protein
MRVPLWFTGVDAGRGDGDLQLALREIGVVYAGDALDVGETPLDGAELTAKGRALEPALNAIGRWADHWVAEKSERRRPSRLRA